MYDKHTGQIIGFVSVGDIGENLAAMEVQCTGSSVQPPISTHLLVMMVMHGGEDLTHNPFACLSENRPLFFISDPPYLLKTTRNCWSHSGDFGTRRLSVRISNTYFNSSVLCI